MKENKMIGKMLLWRGLIIKRHKIVYYKRKHKLEAEKKQVIGYFKRQNDEIWHEKTKTWLREGNLVRESNISR